MCFIFDEVRNTVKYWWISLILGLLFIGLSLFLIFFPEQGYGTLVVLFSVFMLVTGLVETVFYLWNRNNIPGWGWYFANGVIVLILGILLVVFPATTAILMPYIFAIWILFGGMSAIGFSIQLQATGIKTWGWYVAFGVLGIILSFIILWNPFAGAVMSLILVAFSFLLMGINRIMMAFEFKSIHEKVKEFEEK